MRIESLGGSDQDSMDISRANLNRTQATPQPGIMVPDIGTPQVQRQSKLSRQKTLEDAYKNPFRSNTGLASDSDKPEKDFDVDL